MKSRELVDHIRSGPTDLTYRVKALQPLPFRRRTFLNGRFNPCDFDKFLQALQSSKTIRTVTCDSQYMLGITNDEWVLLVKTIGRIRDIKNLWFWCSTGSREFRLFQAVADAVNNAASLCSIIIGLGSVNFPGDPSGLATFASALRAHKALQEFISFEDLPSWTEATQNTAVRRALPACPHLRKVFIATNCACTGAVKNLLQLPKDAHLRLILNAEHRLAVADEIRQCRCNIKRLHIVSVEHSSSAATEADKAIASAIRLDRNLESLTLRMDFDFRDEAGMALAEALTVNKTLRKFTLSLRPCRQVEHADALSTPAYNALSVMLRVNTSLILELPPFNDAVGDEKLVDSGNQMLIEQRLNTVGRGRLLASNQTPRKEWVDALNELNSSNVDESPEFNVSCLYSLLRLNPATCML